MGNAPLVGKPTEEIRAALESGELKGLILFGVDPLRDFPDTKAWETAITAADFVVCFSMYENATSAKADVLFPLETHAEKDGTVTHPDGRLQRVRPSAGRPGDIRPNIQVLAALSTALGQDTGIASQPTAFAALTRPSPSTPPSLTPTSAAAASAGRTPPPPRAGPKSGRAAGDSERFAPLAQPTPDGSHRPSQAGDRGAATGASSPSAPIATSGPGRSRS